MDKFHAVIWEKYPHEIQGHKLSTWKNIIDRLIEEYGDVRIWTCYKNGTIEVYIQK